MILADPELHITRVSRTKKVKIEEVETKQKGSGDLKAEKKKAVGAKAKRRTPIEKKWGNKRRVGEGRRTTHGRKSLLEPRALREI